MNNLSFSWPRAVVSSMPVISLCMLRANQQVANRLREQVNSMWVIRPELEKNYYQLMTKKWTYFTISTVISFASSIISADRIIKNAYSSDSTPYLLGASLVTTFVSVFAFLAGLAKIHDYQERSKQCSNRPNAIALAPIQIVVVAPQIQPRPPVIQFLPPIVNNSSFEDGDLKSNLLQQQPFYSPEGQPSYDSSDIKTYV